MNQRAEAGKRGAVSVPGYSHEVWVCPAGEEKLEGLSVAGYVQGRISDLVSCVNVCPVFQECRDRLHVPGSARQVQRGVVTVSRSAVDGRPGFHKSSNRPYRPASRSEVQGRVPAFPLPFAREGVRVPRPGPAEVVEAANFLSGSDPVGTLSRGQQGSNNRSVTASACQVERREIALPILRILRDVRVRGVGGVPLVGGATGSRGIALYLMLWFGDVTAVGPRAALEQCQGCLQISLKSNTNRLFANRGG